MLDYNNTPLPECEGFTPLQMHKIIYSPFDEDCPVKIKKLNKEKLTEWSPVFKIIIELLLTLKTKKIKLTRKGNLPLKIINDIYAKNYLPDELIESGIIKVRSETDWIVLHNSKLVLLLSGLARKQYNFLLLTKKCESLLKEEKYSEIFYEFLQAFTLKFNWAYNDAYDNEELGQLGFLYSLYLLRKYGNEKKDIKYYTDLYFSAFPSFTESENGSRSMNESAFHTRFITRFALWFGFAEEDMKIGKSFWEFEIKIKRTEFLEQLLEAN
jgi:hypothetical protein